MLDKRDPRKDPKPGDVVRLRNGVEAECHLARDGWVSAALSSGRRICIKLSGWINDCSDAEVLHVAPE
jgi:hypothetical protein